MDTLYHGRLGLDGSDVEVRGWHAPLITYNRFLLEWKGPGRRKVKEKTEHRKSLMLEPMSMPTASTYTANISWQYPGR